MLVPYLTPQTVMQARFTVNPRPQWSLAIMCFRESSNCGILIDTFKAVPLPSYKIFYGIDAEGTSRQVFQADIGGHQVGIITGLSWGGPQAAILVEELAHLEVKTIIGYGLAGAINPRLKKGDPIVASSSLPIDGTSKAYSHSNQPVVNGDESLLNLVEELFRENGICAHAVCAANIDALYRETTALIDEFVSQGADIVNMETSALYTAALACGVSSIWLGHISDILQHGEWEDWNTDPVMTNRNTAAICYKLVHRLCL